MSGGDSVGLQTETRDGVCYLTLDRPQAANAVHPDLRDALIEALEVAGASAEVRVVVLRAHGKQFCAGADLSRMGGGATRRPGDVTELLLRGAQRLISAILDCRKPVIAAVQGTAAGLGAHMAYASDIVIAAEEASFIESFVLRGIVVDAGGAYLLPRRMGLQKAKELAFLGDRLPAQEAQALGLVNRVVPADQLDATVEAWARRLASGPTTAIALAKRMFNRSVDVDRATAYLEEAMAQELNARTLDSKEGVQSFLERRPPNFTGV